MKNTFWKLLEESILVTGLVTLGFVSTACYLFVTGQEVPPLLTNMLYLTLAFFFGAKSQGRVNRAAGGPR